MYGGILNDLSHSVGENQKIHVFIDFPPDQTEV